MPNGLTRLTEPMVRDKGALRVATWDEALDRAAQGLQRAVERKFARQVLGTNNVDSCNRT
jgi:formate dehydrogenase (hydrogenase)